MGTLKLVLTVVDVIAAVFLTAVIMLHSGKSAGLSGAIAAAPTPSCPRTRPRAGRQAGPLDQVGGHRLMFLSLVIGLMPNA
jgi:preprotein translocase subunit SecG